MKPDRFLILYERLNRLERRQWSKARTARRARRLDAAGHEMARQLNRHIDRCDAWSVKGAAARRGGLPFECLDRRLPSIAQLSWAMGWTKEDDLKPGGESRAYLNALRRSEYRHAAADAAEQAARKYC